MEELKLSIPFVGFKEVDGIIKELKVYDFQFPLLGSELKNYEHTWSYNRLSIPFVGFSCGVYACFYHYSLLFQFPLLGSLDREVCIYLAVAFPFQFPLLGSS